MFYNLVEGKVKAGNTYLDYIAFGKGEKNLIIIQGLNVRDIKGSGISLAVMYRIFARDYRIYLFDRRRDVPEGFSNWDIANDIYKAICELGIERADVFGVSQGGMIAMALAIEHSETVNKLVLCATASRPNETILSVVGRWREYALKGDYLSLNRETFSLMYTEKYLRKYRMIIPILEKR